MGDLMGSQHLHPWLFRKSSVDSPGRPLACFTCSANASQARLGFMYFKTPDLCFHDKCWKKLRAEVPWLLALQKPCWVFCKARPGWCQTSFLCTGTAAAPSRDSSISAELPVLEILWVAYGVQTRFVGQNVQSSEGTLGSPQHSGLGIKFKVCT